MKEPARPSALHWVVVALLGAGAIYASFSLWLDEGAENRRAGDTLLCQALRAAPGADREARLRGAELAYAQAMNRSGFSADPLPVAVVRALRQALRAPAAASAEPLEPRPADPALLLAGCLAAGTPTSCRRRLGDEIPAVPRARALEMLSALEEAGCFRR